MKDEERQVFQINLKGCASKKLFNSFKVLAAKRVLLKCGSATRITFAIRDQAELRSLLSHIWDLNLSIHSLRCQESTKQTNDTEEKHGSD